MLEFTGERIVPGAVEADLWNEHLSRYLFAARLTRNRRVVDLGCGAGYGSAALARAASHTWGVDNSMEAIQYASAQYSAHNLEFLLAPCQQTTLPDADADLVIAFELIEHITEPEALVIEAKRLLTPSGQFVLSTPNTDFYRQTRLESGPNPFHRHEFTFDELRRLLAGHFNHVTLFAQNHAAVLSFQPLTAAPSSPVVQFERLDNAPHDAHFFLAVCSLTPQVGAPHFLYVPSTANVLAERQRHIELLNGELALKQQWLDQTLSGHQQLASRHDALQEELRAANEWAQTSAHELDDKSRHIRQTEAHLASAQQELNRLAGHLATRDQELDEKIAHNLALQDALTAAETDLATAASEIKERDAELAEKITHVTILLQENEHLLNILKATLAERDTAQGQADHYERQAATLLEALQRAESTLEERTVWAQTLDHEVTQLRRRLNEAAASRWLRLGRQLHLGPNLNQ